MVAASPRVYVLQELDSLLTWDAAHKDTRGAALVHLSVEKDESLGAMSHTPCLSLVCGQSAVDETLQKGVAPVWSGAGGSDSMSMASCS